MKILIEVELAPSPAEELSQALRDLETRIQQKIESSGHVSIADIATGLDMWTRLQTLPDKNLRVSAENYLRRYTAEVYARVVRGEMEQLAAEAKTLAFRCRQTVSVLPSSSIDARQDFLRQGGTMEQVERIEAAARQAVERHTAVPEGQ